MPVKGQQLSTESIEKMKQAKMQRIVSKYNWIIAEPYMDVEIKNGSVKRINKYITLGEFRQNIESHLTIKDMVSTGVSRKVIQFFSNFCQGKIKLTKSQFEEEYKDGKSLEEICKKYKVTREDLTYLRQLYNIKRKGATFIKRKKTEILLTQFQKEVLYGSMMGDAYKMSESSAIFKHGEPQKEYLMWKWQIFKNICSEKSLKNYSQYDKRYKKFYTGWRFYTRANTDIEKCINEFYKEGIKEVTPQILNKITPLGLAVWFMDDGIGGYGAKYRTGYNYTPEIIFCTECFSEQSLYNIIEWFLDEYGFFVEHRKRKLKNRTSYRIIIRQTSVNDFIDLIRPHIVPSMLYKIDYEAYKEKRQYEDST